MLNFLSELKLGKTEQKRLFYFRFSVDIPGYY